MSYKLEKPYTNEQYADFVVEHNHNNGRLIEETLNAVYALEVDEMLDECKLPIKNPNYEAEQAQKEAERIAKLNLTAADVERAIYKVKGMDFEDILNFVSEHPLENLDIKALKIELRANNFYRGNPYIDTIGTLLGFTKKQLDGFFQDGNYEYLLPVQATEESE